MTVLFDARAAYLYPGTGMGTYSRQILLQFIQSGLHLPPDVVGFWCPDRRIGSAQLRKDLIRLSNSLEKEPHFWSALMEKPIKSRGDEVIHLPNNGLGGSVDSKARVLVTIHDLIPYLLPETCSKEYLKLFTSQIPEILEKAHLIIAVSYHTQMDLERTFGLTGTRIRVIPEAPDPIYRPMERDISQATLKQIFGLDQPFILYIGGFSPRKNLTALIRAFARVRRDLNTPHQLVIVGKPGKGSYPDCRRLVTALKVDKWVRFPGFVPTRLLPFFYNAASVFVYPSLYEGFGLPPMEAMACGTPTVTSNRSSLPEVVGDGALQVEPDPISLGEAIVETINRPEVNLTLRERGRRRASEFSWKKTAQMLAQIYLEALEEG
jgi:glycosyltransferase involved in cell wall biosynthesis